MKKNLIFCAALAVITLFASCNKQNATVNDESAFDIKTLQTNYQVEVIAQGTVVINNNGVYTTEPYTNKQTRTGKVSFSGEDYSKCVVSIDGNGESLPLMNPSDLNFNLENLLVKDSQLGFINVEGKVTNKISIDNPDAAINFGLNSDGLVYFSPNKDVLLDFKYNFTEAHPINVLKDGQPVFDSEGKPVYETITVNENGVDVIKTVYTTELVKVALFFRQK